MIKKIPTNTAVILLVLCAGLAAVIVMRVTDDPLSKDYPFTSEPVIRDGIELKVGISNNELVFGDTIQVLALVKNVSSNDRVFSYNSTCTEGVLSIDGKKLYEVRGCGQALTDLVLTPGEQKEYTHSVNISKPSEEVKGKSNVHTLEPGEHVISYVWNDLESSTMNFSVK